VPDQVYLSYWLRGFTTSTLPRRLETALRAFPFSRLSPRLELAVYAIEYSEPPALERTFEGPGEIDELLAAAVEFLHDDCAVEVAGFWDLWQWSEETLEWNLRPSSVLVSCYAPRFPSDSGEQLRFAFGPEAPFVPSAGRSGEFTAIRSNVRSLLHLAGDMDRAFNFERRTLWSESGENLARRLEEALGSPD
jgi:hypothetical protein